MTSLFWRVSCVLTLLIKRIAHSSRMNETQITLQEETISARFREIQLWDERVNLVIGEIGAINQSIAQSIALIRSDLSNLYAAVMGYGSSR